MFTLGINLAVLLFIFPSLLNAQETITPSHVYHEALKIRASLAKISNNNTELIQRIQMTSAQPLHVYAIATALNEKIAILNELNGNAEIIRPEFPNENIEPKHVFKLVLAMQSNLKKIVPNQEIIKHNKIIATAKTPVDVLRIILACNILIDSLIREQLTPKHPYSILKGMELNLTNATALLNKKLPDINFSTYPKVDPTDVFVNAEILFKSLTNTSHLKFNVDFPKRPYYLPYKESNIKPMHVFTVSVINDILLKDLIRRSGYSIKPRVIKTEASDIKPENVYMAYERVLLLSRLFIMWTSHQNEASATKSE